MGNKKYYVQRSEIGQINLTNFNYMLHKYLIQIKKKYSTKLIDIDHMKPPIASFSLFSSTETMIWAIKSTIFSVLKLAK